MSERINMKCPSCNGSFIFIGEGGYLTCSYVDCPEPDIAKKVVQLEAENEASLELLEEARDLILRLRQKAGQVGMWEVILGRIDALLTDTQEEE